MIRAQRMVVIAAPSGAGKTRLIRSLADDAHAGLRAALGMDRPAVWRFENAIELRRMGDAEFDCLVVHYDIYAQQAPGGEFHLVRDLRDARGLPPTLTLLVSAEALLSRSRSRLHALRARGRTGADSIQGDAATLDFARARQLAFETPGFVDSLYRAWFAFADRIGVAQHWVARVPEHGGPIPAPLRRHLGPHAGGIAGPDARKAGSLQAQSASHVEAAPSFRRACAADAPGLSALAMRSKAHWGYSQEFMEACREELTVRAEDISRSTADVVVAEREGRPVGFYAIEAGADGVCELEALFVEPACIGRGCGKALLRHAVRTAARRRATKLVIQGDPHAARFYLAAGAAPAGSRQSASIPGRRLPLFEIDLSRAIPLER